MLINGFCGGRKVRMGHKKAGLAARLVLAETKRFYSIKPIRSTQGLP
jgi:hypothetical protein